MLKLAIKKRDTKEKLDRLREGGFLPAVYYGSKTDSTPISIQVDDFKKVWYEAGESTVIELSDGDKTKDALIQEVSVHAVTDEPIHADFYIVEEGQTLTVEVPFEFVGEAPALRDFDATLIKVMHELEVETTPRALPHEITIDVSGLKEIDQNITVGDIKLPEGVTALADPEDVIVSVAEVVEEEEEEEEEPVEFDADAIEVEHKGKALEEGEESESEGEEGGEDSEE